MINSADSKKLLKLARLSISSEFAHKHVDLSEAKKLFANKQGVFVTLKSNNELRGCIGFPEPVLPLYDAVVESARAAAFSDPRFIPLNEEEFKKIKIEMSVLTVPEEIKVKKIGEYFEKIVIGKDGLIIRKSFFSGLLLPQVFTEYKCTPKQALEMTCHKAGLPKDAWKDKSCKIFKFQAEVIAEE